MATRGQVCIFRPLSPAFKHLAGSEVVVKETPHSLSERCSSLPMSQLGYVVIAVSNKQQITCVDDELEETDQLALGFLDRG